jgi:hypothetical protein
LLRAEGPTTDFVVAWELLLTDFVLPAEGPLRGLASTSAIAARLKPRATAVIATDRISMCFMALLP